MPWGLCSRKFSRSFQMALLRSSQATSSWTKYVLDGSPPVSGAGWPIRRSCLWVNPHLCPPRNWRCKILTCAFRSQCIFLVLALWRDLLIYIAQIESLETRKYWRLCLPTLFLPEPRGNTDQFELVLQRFYDAVNSDTSTPNKVRKVRPEMRLNSKRQNVSRNTGGKASGAAFLAVCRGKVSSKFFACKLLAAWLSVVTYL